MKKMRALLALAVAGAMALGLAACTADGGSGGDTGTGGDKGLIGISMPTKSVTRWIEDGESLRAELEAAGYTVDLQFAEDDIPTQVSQLENMITKGAQALVIAAIDGTTLTGVLDEAAAGGIPTIAYDRLIRDSEHVSYYATFDNFVVGQQQAWGVLNGLGLTELDGAPIAGAPSGPFNVELFAGSLDDNNSYFFYDGAMDVLQPLIDDGTLVVKSGQIALEQVATPGWDPEVAQSRMEDLLAAQYSDGSKVNGILSPYDGISRGIISALTDAGYSVGPEWPSISGQNGELDSIKAILAGEQHATVFKDTRELAAVAAGMVIAILEGREPTVNDTTSYDNGVRVVPSYLLTPIPVNAENAVEVMVGSGYYTKEERGL